MRVVKLFVLLFVFRFVCLGNCLLRVCGFDLVRFLLVLVDLFGVVSWCLFALFVYYLVVLSLLVVIYGVACMLFFVVFCFALFRLCLVLWLCVCFVC